LPLANGFPLGRFLTFGIAGLRLVVNDRAISPSRNF
jgi:hypothetical protein